MRMKFTFKSLLLACALLTGSVNAWAQEYINTFPYTTGFGVDDPNPFDSNASITNANASVGYVLQVKQDVTATATFGDETNPYELQNGEEVTVSFKAFHGWSNGGSHKVALLNSDNEELVSYTYYSSDQCIDDVYIGGVKVNGSTSLSSQSLQSNGTSGADGLTNSKSFCGTEGYNPIITMTVRQSGIVSFRFEFGKRNIDEVFTGSVGEMKKDLRYLKLIDNSKVGGGDRDICIDDLSITSEISQAAQYTYKVNYVDKDNDNEVLKSESGVGEEGMVVPVSKADFWVGDKKYKYVSDDAEDNKLEKDNTIITVECQEYDKFTYTLKAVTSDNVELETVEGTQYEGETKTLYLKKALKKDDVWYTTNPASYQVSFTKDNATQTITYNATDIVYFFEGEDLNFTGTGSSPTGAADRMSNGQAPRLWNNSSFYTDALEGGVYNITIRVRNQRGAANTSETFSMLYVKNGDTQTALDVNFPDWANSEISEKTIYNVTIPDGYSFVIANDYTWNSNLEVDYLVFEKAPAITATSNENLEGYKTFYNASANFEVDENTTIYKAAVNNAGDAVVLTEVEGKIVAAGNAVLLQTKDDVEWTITLTPTIEESEGDFGGNELEATEEAGTKENAYILARTNNNELGFYQYSGEFKAGEVYLPVEKSLGIKYIAISVGGVATAVETVEAAEAEAGATYNVAGQQVGSDYKGIVIKNGKKYLNK